MIKDKMRIWFIFDVEDVFSHPSRMRFCGVTAANTQQAIYFMNKQVFNDGNQMPPIKRIVMDVDVSTLDPNHILPNIGDVTRPGVWWPSLNLYIGAVPKSAERVC